MKKILTLLLLSFCAAAGAQNHIERVPVAKTYKYRVYLADKKDCGFSVKKPEQFLSQKAIDRRKKFGLKVDRHDLPVTPAYLTTLRQRGLRVCQVSKWNNTAVVETTNPLVVSELVALAFVDSVKKVYESPDSVVRVARRDSLVGKLMDTADVYGYGLRQAHMIGADKLHQAGFCGDGMTIAVIDGGFHNAEVIEALRSCQVLGTRNFVDPHRSVYDDQSHGTMVLSCIGTNLPGTLVGTAPNAAFYLLQSEDGATEFPVEEDNWCAALEYADSLGVDLVTTSLGYYQYDDPALSHKYYELNGLTAVNSRSASLAASRGLVLLNSAGNSGRSAWKKIGFPADARDILAVGAVNADGLNTRFSSVGNSADGRVKPDVMAMGERSAVIDSDGSLTFVNGTSFSCPILCGGVACLMQAFPNKRPEVVIDAVRRSGNNANHPDNIFGYGIPDLWKAYEILKSSKK